MNLKTAVKILAKLSLFILLFSMAGWLCRKQTDGFTLAKISSFSCHNSERKIVSDAEKTELQNILQQPFTYLAKGNQCFVFVSQDQKYVIKFFRHHKPSFWKKPFIKEPLDTLSSDFASYLLAFEKLKDETGLVFLHLNQTKNLEITLTIVDKINIAHKLSLDSMGFLLQRRAQLLYPTLQEKIEKKQLESGKTILSELVHLLKKRYEKGVLDADSDLDINFGCIGTTPIQIDVGRFSCGEKDRVQQKEEILKITDNLHQWLEARSPLLDEHLKTEIATLWPK